MNKTIGFIGGGNMATAIIGGILSSKLVAQDSIVVSDRYKDGLEQLHKKYGVEVTTDNQVVAAKSDILFLCVKPNIYAAVIEEIRNCTREKTLIVSIAPGLSISYLEELFQKAVKLIRSMPNTPALVGEGMSALCHNALIEEEELESIKDIFESFGETEIVSEYLMNTVVGVSGSSPAYIYILIEAMADAAVADGMPRKQAYKFAAQSVLGSAKMVMDTGIHPGELKDMVCSPGGATIEAVDVLERTGFRSSIISAQRACVEKSKQMGK